MPQSRAREHIPETGSANTRVAGDSALWVPPEAWLSMRLTWRRPIFGQTQPKQILEDSGKRERIWCSSRIYSQASRHSCVGTNRKYPIPLLHAVQAPQPRAKSVCGYLATFDLLFAEYPSDTMPPNGRGLPAPRSLSGKLKTKNYIKTNRPHRIISRNTDWFVEFHGNQSIPPNSERCQTSY